MSSPKEIYGQDLNGAYMWQGRKLFDGSYISTSPGFLLVSHLNFQSLIEFWLEQVPNTNAIKWDANYISVPSVLPKSRAQLIIDEINNEL
jgi:hypothetical protein